MSESDTSAEQIDLSTYLGTIFAAFVARMAELSQYLASIHLACANYDASSVRDETLLMSLVVKGQSLRAGDDRYSLTSGTEDFAMRMGILGLCTAVEECLAGMLTPCLMLEHLALDRLGRVRGADWRDAWLRVRKRLDNTTLGGLVTTLGKVASDAVRHVSSDTWSFSFGALKDLVTMRNCIAHRFGRVSAVDLEPGSEAFGFYWRSTTVLLDGTPLAGAPKRVDSGTPVEVTHTTRIRQWRVGEHILFTPLEAQQIAEYLIQVLRPVRSVIEAALSERLNGSFAVPKE